MNQSDTITASRTPSDGVTSLKIERWMVWSGLLVVAFLLPTMLWAHMIPPHSPSASAEAIAKEFTQHKTAIRLACAVMLVGISFWALWCVAIAACLRRMERGFPILTNSALVLGAVGTVIFAFCPFLWVVAAFRPDTISPEITRAINDAAWILLVWPAPPFSLWAAIVGIGILNDKGESPVLPRWLGYANLLFAGDAFFTMTCAIFKSGPFSWDGLMTFWNPLASFGALTVVMTIFMRKALQDVVD